MVTSKVLLGKAAWLEMESTVNSQKAEQEILRFIISEDPEVLCIRGRWGIGKTYAWEKYLKEAKSKINFGRYAYVSLFGINSLEDFKYAIFENSIDATKVGTEPNLESFQSNPLFTAKHFGKKSLRFLEQIPLIKNHVGNLSAAWFLSVTDTIICVDDIERAGKNLAVRDILGLVSHLKDRKKCKVVLILNDEAIEASSEKEEFSNFFEKVVDISIRFSPTPEECARIALEPRTPRTDLLLEHTTKLGISNIRVIKKIDRLFQQIERDLSCFDPLVMKEASHTLALLGWCNFEPKASPSLEFLKKETTITVIWS